MTQAVLRERRKKINYQKTLRYFAKSMVRLRRPERLLKMITRFIDQDFGLSHTSLLILDERKKHYIFYDSKGSKKIPVGLIRFDFDHPIILWFKSRGGGRMRKDYLSASVLVRALGRTRLSEQKKKEMAVLTKSIHQLGTELVVPAFYKNSLVALLLLGKKTDGQKFTSSEISFFQILAQDCSMALKTAEYHRSLVNQNRELADRIREVERLHRKERETFYEVMRSLAQEVYAKDPYTFGHISQVERLGLMTARELGLDLSGKRKDILSASLILHDVGKIGIPDEILKKPAALSRDEWKMMKTHVEKGAKILAHLSDFQEAAEIVRSHHEFYDGTGYPRGLQGDQIPIEARIVSVVDAFHAIISSRCYRKSRPVEEAFQELRRCSGSQFDAQVVEAFIRALEKEMKAAREQFTFEAAS